jgi:UDP-glucose 6-dehydrogenase
VSLIAVGTPSRDGEIDLTAVLGVARTIGAWLPDAGRWHTVVVKSTVVPGPPMARCGRPWRRARIGRWERISALA